MIRLSVHANVGAVLVERPRVTLLKVGKDLRQVRHHVGVQLSWELRHAAGDGDGEGDARVDGGGDGGGPTAAAEAKHDHVLVAQGESLVDGKNL